MTVMELIGYLRTYPGEMEVCLRAEAFGCDHLYSVKSVMKVVPQDYEDNPDHWISDPSYVEIKY